MNSRLTTGRAGLTVVAATLLVAGCGGGGEPPPPAPRIPSVIDLATTGTLSGSVAFTGKVPDRRKIRMGGTPQCKQHQQTPPLSEELIVQDGNLVNAFVHIKNGMHRFVYPVPAVPVRLDQVGCIFTPHVIGVQVDQEVQLINSDPILHNVHTYPKVNESWNIGFPYKGMKQIKRLSRQEVMIEYRCDVHGWMKGYIGVVDHPFFAVTGSDGSFRFEGVPAGKYTVEVWHETLGSKSQEVEVGAGKASKLDFSFSQG